MCTNGKRVQNVYLLQKERRGKEGEQAARRRFIGKKSLEQTRKSARLAKKIAIILGESESDSKSQRGPVRQESHSRNHGFASFGKAVSLHTLSGAL